VFISFRDFVVEFFFEFLFLLDIFSIYISNVIPFPGFPSKTSLSYPSSPCSPIYPLPLFSPKLGHQTFSGPKTSPPIDVQQGNPLLHMQLESWVPPCVLFCWLFSPWELWEYWLVHIFVPPIGLQTQLLGYFL
jgi:hypothetical protein